jgi:transposase InsO family protein
MRLRFTTHDRRGSLSRLPSQQGASRAADERQRYPGPPQAPLSRDNRFSAQAAGGAKRVEPNFTPAEPNQVFASDITYIWTDEGWLYLGARWTCSIGRSRAGRPSFFNSLKNERVYGTRYRTHRQAVADSFEYIEMFYNRGRRLRFPRFFAFQ